MQIYLYLYILNAFEQSKYYGAQTFYPKGKDDGKELAQFVQDELKRVVDEDNDRKIKPRDDIYLLKNATDAVNFNRMWFPI